MATALLLAAVLCLPATAAGGTVNASLPAGGAQSGNASLPAAGAGGNASLPAAGAQVPESALPGAETGLLGRVVEEIRVLVAGGQESGWLKEIPLKVGERLERDKVRESLRALYRSGRFAEVEADATVLPSGGVVVEFRTKPNYFNGNVTVTGLPKGGPNDSEVVSTAGLELGARVHGREAEGFREPHSAPAAATTATGRRRWTPSWSVTTRRSRWTWSSRWRRGRRRGWAS